MRAVFAACAASALLSAGALAHHSPAAFDVTKELLIAGTLAEVDWRNPHVYLTVETTDAEGAPVLQEIEGVSVSAMRSMGVDRDRLTVGAPVVVRAFANRRGHGVVLGADITLEDGSVHPITALGRGSQGPVATTPAESIAGNWTPPQNPGLIPTVYGWPITPAGRAAVAATSTNADARTVSLGCAILLQPPMLTMLPQLRTIAVTEDTATMAVDADGLAAERTIHLGQTEHPADLAPSPLGHSIGWWEGETLVIDTVAFEPHITGIGFGVPSGLGKHLVERLTLTEDHLGLQYELTVEDPEYLSAPATYTAVWMHRPDLEPSGQACDEDNAARYLEE